MTTPSDRTPAPNDTGTTPAPQGDRKEAGTTAQSPDSGAAAASAQPTREKPKEWWVYGIGLIAQIAAETAARRAGMRLGPWISQLVRENTDPSPAQNGKGSSD